MVSRKGTACALRVLRRATLWKQVGALIGEDPRYFELGTDAPFRSRVGRIVKWTFLAPNHDGDLHPAYARYLAIAGSNALSNTWRADSEADTAHFAIEPAWAS